MRRPTVARRFRDDDGVALVTAVLLTMVVLAISMVAFGLSKHNLDSSSTNRQRIQGLGAAEAGINYAMSHIQTTAPTSLQCSFTGNLQHAPGSYATNVEYYTGAGTLLPCPIGLGQTPTTAVIRSTGTSQGNDPERRMRAELTLLPIVGAPFGPAAVFSDLGPNLNSGLNIVGLNSGAADIYTNGNAVLNPGTIGGNVYAQGTASMSNNSRVTRNLWANGNISMQGNSRVDGAATSSTSSISPMSSGSRIGGDAKAATTVARPQNVSGLTIENTPSGPPPAIALPSFTYSPGDWQAAGYNTTPTYAGATACTEAKDFIQGITSGDWAIRINANCTLAFTAASSLTLRGNLVIVSDGNVTFGPNTVVSAEPPGSQWSLYMFMKVGSSNCTTTEAFRTDASVSMGGSGTLKTIVWTPCLIRFASAGFVFNGQVFAGKVEFNASGTFTYVPVSVPVYGVVGFEEDVRYVIECSLSVDPGC